MLEVKGVRIMAPAGTQETICRIVEEYSDMLLRLACTRLDSTQDAEDAVQEVFLSLLSSKPVFRDAGHEKAWLINTQIMLDYDRTFAEKHHVYAMVGASNESYTRQGNQIKILKVDEDLGIKGDGSEVDPSGSYLTPESTTRTSLTSVFGRVGYDFKGKYFIEGTFRYDGSSKFDRDFRWGFFPSVSAGWRISEEKFFEPVRNWFNNLKIRYSFGQLGNQQVGYYDYIRKISISNQTYLFGGGKPTTATISAPVASDLTWEVAQHQNLGVDMAFFDNRLGFTGEFYIRDTKDMLTEGVALPSVYGASSPKMNSADLRTKGYELTLAWKDMFTLAGKPFSYNVSVVFSDYITEITEYDNPEKTFAKSYYEGMRWGEIWGYRTGGFFASDAEAAAWPVDQTSVNEIINASAGAEKGLRAGDLKYLDLDGDNKISL